MPAGTGAPPGPFPCHTSWEPGRPLTSTTSRPETSNMDRRARAAGPSGAVTANTPPVGFGPSGDSADDRDKRAPGVMGGTRVTVIAPMKLSVPPLGVVTRNLT